MLFIGPGEAGVAAVATAWAGGGQPARTERAATGLLVSGGGAIQVVNADELEKCVAGLLDDPSWRERLRAKAQQIALENQGAVARTVDMTCEHLSVT